MIMLCGASMRRVDDVQTCCGGPSDDGVGGLGSRMLIDVAERNQEGASERGTLEPVRAKQGVEV